MDKPTIVLRKSGTLLEISLYGTDKPPVEVRGILESLLTFKPRKFNYGANRWDDYGHRGAKVTEQLKKCWRYDGAERLITNFGYIYRVHAALREAGYSAVLHDTPLIPTHPKAYEFDWANVERHFQFRPTQADCLWQIINKPCGIIHAVTGFGKAVMIAMVCLAFPYAKIAVVTRSRTLVNKLNTFLTRYLPNVGQFGAGRKQAGRVTVYTVKSLHHSKFDEDILLVDEGHQVIAEDGAALIARFLKSRNYAFSASPYGRIDGTDYRMEALFGIPIFHLSYPQAVELGLVVPIDVLWSNVYLKTNPASGLEDVEKKRMGIWCNQERNAIIAADAKKADDENQVLALTETIEHAVHLRQFLPHYTLVYDKLEDKRFDWYKAQGMLPGDEPDMTAERKENLRIRFEAGDLKHAIATKMWATGIDPVQLAVLIRTEAADSEIMDTQAPGRVARIVQGKATGIVRDYRDQFDDGFRRRGLSRSRHYDAHGWEQYIDLGDNILPLKGSYTVDPDDFGQRE